MLTTRRYRATYGGNICRRCINAKLDIHLRPPDCRYEPERGVCPSCREADKHIVAGFTVHGLLKVIRK